MKFSISNIAWKAEWDREIYQKLLSIGFSAIEIAPLRTLSKGYESTTDDVNAWLKEYRTFFTEISSMQSLLFKMDIQLFDSLETVDYVLGILEKGLLFASNLNVQTLVFGSPTVRNVNSVEHLDRSRVFFGRFADMALEHHIHVALEPNPKIYNTNFMNTTYEALEYVKSFNHPNFGINLDLGTVIENNETIHDIIDKENIKWIKHVHISEPYLVSIRSDHSDLHAQLFNTLKAVSYDRYVSIEMKPGLEIREIFDVLDYIKDKGIEAGILNEK